jgi:hypothetical protein
LPRYRPKQVLPTLLPKQTALHAPEPLLWELASSCLQLPGDQLACEPETGLTTGQTAHHISLPSCNDPFAMHLLHAALPDMDPMSIESTLPPPILPNTTSLCIDTTSLIAPTTKPMQAWSEPTPAVVHGNDTVIRPDGETWLPRDPSHGYEGPSVFGLGTDGKISTQQSATPPQRTLPLLIQILKQLNSCHGC